MDKPASARNLSDLTRKTLAGRRFVMATMPVGPFSRRLAEAIRARGGEAKRVLTNGGDRLDWGAPNALRPRRGADWGEWLGAELGRWPATDVITMGDFNQYSATALAVARALNLRTHVLEQGYLRPNWITCEPWGVNANSTLPRDPAFYRQLPPPPPFVAPQNISPITPPEAIANIRYFSAVAALGRLFPDFTYPHAFTFPQQFRGHAARAFGKLVGRRVYEARQMALMKSEGPLFILLLQREGDSQFRAHSSEIRDNPNLIETAISSFAAFAPEAARLAVRNHPLDPAIFDLRAITGEAAARHGIGARVSYLDYTTLAPMLPATTGAVTLNSTAAMTTIEFGVPTKILGRAFFDIEGLVDDQPLNQFWRNPCKPDQDLFERFRHYILTETQIFGNFFNIHHMTATASALADRFVQPSGAILDYPGADRGSNAA
jgi:capsular polysaccharide export protein